MADGSCHRLPPCHEVVVAARQSGAPQCGQHGHAIDGVVSTTEHGEDVPHLVRSPQHGDALQPVGDAGVLERFFERPERSACREEDSDVAPPRGARFAVLLVHHRPPRADDVVDGDGHLVGGGAPDVGHARLHRSAEEDHGGHALEDPPRPGRSGLGPCLGKGPQPVE
jgi:hypothetical protein